MQRRACPPESCSTYHHYLHDDVRLVLILHNLCKSAAIKEDAGYLNTEVFLSAQQMQDITGPLAVLLGEAISCTMRNQRACQKAKFYVLSEADPEITLSFTMTHFPAGLILQTKMISLATSDRSCSAAPQNSQHLKPGWKGSSVPQVLGSQCISRTAPCYRAENKYMYSYNWEYLHLPTTICSSGQKLWSSFIKLHTTGQK